MRGHGILPAAASLLLVVAAARAADEKAGEESPSRLSDEPIPLKTLDVPGRPASVLEIGDGFFHPGKIGDGFTLPTGAVWQPSLLVFGTFRTGLGHLDRGGGAGIGEWANRLDLFVNLKLSATERVLVGFRPLDENNRFSGYNFDPMDREVDGFNLDIRTALFEGDFGEIFPKLDPQETKMLDFGFAVGRQPFLFQDGILVNDTLDAFALVRNSLKPKGISNLRSSFVVAWNEIHRGNNVEDDEATLLALFNEFDTHTSTVEVDLVGVLGSATSGGGDALYFGAGATQRIGRFNTTFRFNLSAPLDGENPFVTRGALLFAEVSWVPHHTIDNVYVNVFVGIDSFSSAARDPSAGGPLGRVGILFAATGLGSAGAPVANRVGEDVGGAVGYQWILDGGRRQVVLELAGRMDYNGAGTSEAAVGARFQQALRQNYIVIVDGFVGYRELVSDAIWGVRLEFQVKF